MSRRPRRIEHDWYPGEIPLNVVFGENVYVDTSYSFAPFLSTRDAGLSLGDASGVYIRSTFVVGPSGSVRVGAYTCINGAYLHCEERLTLGSHCLLAWGAVITDTGAPPGTSVEDRRRALEAAARHPDRHLAAVSPPRPVVLEDNVWVGFDAVVLPGVTLGEGSVVGCKSLVTADVPPNTVVVGNPARRVKALNETSPSGRNHRGTTPQSDSA